MGGYVKQTVPNVPSMTQQRPPARSTPNLTFPQDHYDCYNNLNGDFLYPPDATVEEDNHAVHWPRNEDLHTPITGNNGCFPSSVLSGAQQTAGRAQLSFLLKMHSQFNCF